MVKLMKNHLFIAYSITMIIVLLYFGTVRWSDDVEIKSEAGIVEVIKIDKWSNQIWKTTYRSSNGGLYNEKYGDVSPIYKRDYYISPYIVKHVLTYGWFILTFIFLFFSIYGVIHLFKDKPTDYK